MTSLYVNYLVIAFVVLSLPFFFRYLTNLNNLATAKPQTLWLRFVSPIAVVVTMIALFGVCSLTVAWLYSIHYPEAPFLGMNQSEWDNFMESPAPSYIPAIIMPLMMILPLSLLWTFYMIARRLDAKIYEEPGDAKGRVLFIINYVLQVYSIPVISFFGLVAIIFYDKRLAPNLAALPSLMDAVLKGKGIQASFLFGIILTLAFAIPLAMSLWGLWRSFLSTFWPTTEGVIERSSLLVVRGLRSQSYRFELRYAYRVDGKNYQGERLTYSEGLGARTKPYIWAQTKHYPVGQKVTVHFNPDKPKEAVIETKVDLPGILGIILTLSFFLALALVWFVVPASLQ